METSMWEIWAVEEYDEFSIWSANERENNSIDQNSPLKKWRKVLEASNRLSKTCIITIE